VSARAELSVRAVGEIERTKRNVRLETAGRIALALNDRVTNLVSWVA
jgi:hypothetical protein